MCPKIKEDTWKPDYGPATFVPTWGASIVGARDFLIAYNVNIMGTKEQAQRIALNIRSAGRGPDKVKIAFHAPVVAVTTIITIFTKLAVITTITTTTTTLKLHVLLLKPFALQRPPVLPLPLQLILPVLYHKYLIIKTITIIIVNIIVMKHTFHWLWWSAVCVVCELKWNLRQRGLL